MTPQDPLRREPRVAGRCGCNCRCHADEGTAEWPGACAGCCEPGDNCDCGRALTRLLAAARGEPPGHQDAGNRSRNHYDWFMPDNPTGHVDDILDDFEAKLTESLTDPFVHDMAHSVLPLIAAYREARAARGEPPEPGPAIDAILDAIPMPEWVKRSSYVHGWTVAMERVRAALRDKP